MVCSYNNNSLFCNMKHIHTFENFSNEGQTNQDIKVGDTVGNAVQGFNFEVKKISGDKMTVKDKKSGKEFETFIENMYKTTLGIKV